MNQILNEIIAEKRREVAALPDAKCRAAGDRISKARFGFEAALRRPGLSIVAELKRRSPSRGEIASDLDIADRARRYQAGGASAISCLTDRRFFGARANDLSTGRSAVDLPLLRKDFLIDERQIDESIEMGADAVLLIVRILDSVRLRQLLQYAFAVGLDALVEAHDEREIASAIDAGAIILGVNNRDLDTFEVDFERCLRLRDRIPDSCICVAESGIGSPDQIRRLTAAGYDAALIGESLSGCEDVEIHLQRLRSAGTEQLIESRERTLEAAPQPGLLIEGTSA